MRVRTLSTPLITVQAHTHTSELDIHKACKDRQLQDLLRIVRCNDNFITATFDKISIARHAEIGGGISLSSGAGPKLCTTCRTLLKYSLLTLHRLTLITTQCHSA